MSAKNNSQPMSEIDLVKLARNPLRPLTLDYIGLLIRDFFEIHGDRRYGDDRAIITGFGYFGRVPVAIAGHQRGRTTRERMERNFGRPHPEGYRKAARLFGLADRFRLPILTFIDTQGAEPGVGAEERGQAEAIASNLELMGRLGVPMVCCLIGEGGSGGALALGMGNVILIQEYACYSVITPEGAAAILWREAGPEKVTAAARALKLTAGDLLALGIVDEIVAEPDGGAHLDPGRAANALGRAITRHLKPRLYRSPDAIRQERARKFAAMGAAFLKVAPAGPME